jgi:hypothetical protein
MEGKRFQTACLIGAVRCEDAFSTAAVGADHTEANDHGPGAHACRCSVPLPPVAEFDFKNNED